MKNIIITLLACILISIISSCETDDNFIDTGLAKGTHHKTIMQYFATNSYDWDTTALVIKRGGLEYIFNGTHPDYQQITFFGPTSLSILRYMLENGYKSVDEMPVDICKDMILRHVYNQRKLKDDFEFINSKYGPSDKKQDGGTVITTEGGSVLLVYREKSDYGDIKGGGATHLRIHSISAKIKVPVASPDIQCNNGVVHSLNYNFTFGNI